MKIEFELELTKFLLVTCKQVAPFSLPFPLSNKCGSPSKNTMNPAQELSTANVSKLHVIVLSQRNQLNAYLTNMFVQHHDALTRILKMQEIMHNYRHIITRLFYIFLVFLSYLFFVNELTKKKAKNIFF